MSQEQEYSKLLQELALLDGRVKALELHLTKHEVHINNIYEGCIKMQRCIATLQDYALDYKNFREGKNG